MMSQLMTNLPGILAISTLAGLIILLLLLIREQFERPRLPVNPQLKHWPTVSIIIPACNEAERLEEALLSVLNLDYPANEVIVINDRSTDSTGEIIVRLQEKHPALKVITIQELPSGWLGKNHALQSGADLASGELLLFTDADIVMQPATLRRAVTCLLSHRLDHLALGPTLTTSGALLNSVIGVFMFIFTLYARPWDARREHSKGHIGIGAFNLIRAQAYHAIDGHQAIKLRPDDDMQLGKRLKERGYRQDAVLGDSAITVEWYTSLKEMVAGLEKNSFAGIDYRLTMLIASTIAMLATFIWPFVALITTTGMLWWGNILIVTLLGICFWMTAGAAGMSCRYFLGFPLSILIFIYIMWRSALRILLRGGMEWRGTFYALDELRGKARKKD